MEELPKVLIACPTSSYYKYCLKDFSDAIKNLSYPNFDVLIADNSKQKGYVKEIMAAGLNAEKTDWIPGIIPRVTKDRNFLRDYFLQNKYDYFLSTDSDTILPVNAIQNLMRHDKDVVSGVYFNFHMIDGQPKEVPMVFVNFNEEKDTMEYLDTRHLAKPKLIEASAFGVGCMLVKREVMEKIAFRYDKAKYGAFEDVFFCYDARKAGYKLYADTSVRCEHITVRGGKWKGESLY